MIENHVALSAPLHAK